RPMTPIKNLSASFICLLIILFSFCKVSYAQEITHFNVSTGAEFQQALDAIAAGSANDYTIELKEDINLKDQYRYDRHRISRGQVTLIGNGHTLTQVYTIRIGPGAALRLGKEDGSDRLTIDGAYTGMTPQPLFQALGGALFIHEGVTISNRRANHTSSFGTIVLISSGGTCTMTGGEIKDNLVENSALGSGGGFNGMVTLLGADTSFTMTGGKIINNAVTSHYEPRPGWLPFEEVVYGTAISSVGGAVDIKNAEISGNKAQGQYGMGAGICIFNGSLTVDASVIANNHSDWQGGGIYIAEPADIPFYPITFGGGARPTTIPATPSRVTITDSLIAFNTTGQAGADILIDQGNEAPTLPSIQEMKAFAASKALPYDTAKLVDWHQDAPSKRYSDADPTAVLEVSEPISLPQYLIAAGLPKSHTISFDANGGGGSMAPVETSEATYVLPTASFTPPAGMHFAHWSVLGAVKQPGDEIPLTDDLVIQAVWEKDATASGAGSAGSGGAEISFERQKAYFFGYPDGSIRPDGQMTRAEAIALLVRLEKLPTGAKDRTPFADTAANAWYNTAINAAFKAGYLADQPRAAIRPDDPISRGELAQLIAHVPGKTVLEGPAPFTDIKDSPYWEAIEAGYTKGRIKGYPDQTFRPNQSISRAEVVTIFNQIYSIEPDKDYIAKHPGQVASFKDLSRGHWAYADLIAASTNHFILIKNGARSWLNTFK
ncbi:S-layer homology domain-containing protein, partial [Peptococcus simiae]|uniref:S-layer homology domain-containing protein n=1 Tax=Peptococcus simiae TaxID=1643805 RepID=UPI003980399A